MKIVIDKDQLKEHKIGIAGMCYLLSLWMGSDAINKRTIYKLMNMQLVKCNLDTKGEILDAKLTEFGEDEVNKIILDSEFNEPNKEDRFLILAKKLRELYPTGKKAGTCYMWRDCEGIITLQLKALTKILGEFDHELAVKATEQYVNSFNGNFTYMQILKYFIYKDVLKNGRWEPSSQLLSCITALKEGGQIITNSDNCDLI